MKSYSTQKYHQRSSLSTYSKQKKVPCYETESDDQDLVHQLRLTIAQISKNSDIALLNKQVLNLISKLQQNRNEISTNLIMLLQSIMESMQNQEQQTQEQFSREKSLLLLKLQQLEAQKTKNNAHRTKMKTQIKEMQEKLVQMSQKEKKLIQLVRAVKSRGIDVESIYKNLKPDYSFQSSKLSNQSIVTSQSRLGDQSLISNNTLIIKRNTEYLID